MAKIKNLNYNIEGKTLVIRNARVEDASKLIEQIKQLDSETTFLLREPDEFDLTLEQEQRFIQNKLDSGVELFLVAEVDGELIGNCAINGSNRKRLRHTAELGIAITNKYWGLGIGRRLMENAIAWVKENGITRISLAVDTNNFRALSLYTKLGFQVEGTYLKDKKLADGSYRNTYAMALLLD